MSQAHRQSSMALMEYAIPIFFSSIVSIVAYFITRQDDQIVRTSATIGSALLSYLVADKVFILSRIEQMEKNISLKLASNVNYHRFDSIFEAFEYIVDNAANCKSIKNTRFDPGIASASSATYKGAAVKQDEEIIEAIKRGCNYVIVYEGHRKKDVAVYFDGFKKASGKGVSGVGNFFAYEINARDMPLTQMIILEYRDGRKECLVGWVMATSKVYDAPVYLIRDDKEKGLVHLFNSIFQSYQESGTLVTP